MKKRTLSLILATAMVAGSLVGCGGNTSASSSSAPAQEPAAEAETPAAEAEAASAADDASIVNIYCWNNEFPNRMMDHYPGFEANDPADSTKGGKIGDKVINFIVTDNKDNMYQNKLDEALSAQATAADKDKVDIFLIEADYAMKYTDPEVNVAMPLDELGITDADLSKQFQYTKDVVTDADGKIRGSSWQACSGGLIFNREIAKQVLGSDDLETVQAAVADWDAFNATAQKMKDAGYKIVATVNDTFRVYSNNVSGKWVQDGKIVVDDNVKKWADDSKALVDAGMTTTNDMWSDDWSKGFQAPGDVFCYFGPAWLINFSMGADPSKEDDGSIAHAGGWGLVNGPQGFYWGGTWICAAQGTDNADVVKDIILNMTTNDDIMKDIAVKDSDCVNNKDVLTALATDETFGNAILGGQNPYQMLSDGAEKIDLSNLSEYDQACVEEYQNAMKNFFDGNATYEEALAQFFTAVGEKHPELAQ
ncbi:MAG: carbohydrate ABC transporter substrate-binding protein [Lachnospiraceae bacterium]|nr:carbohydrate ABC transporter substrate-binding protein [Lachnospiraceae bacterium]